eukprot:5081647-Amphidinium_carterae.1
MKALGIRLPLCRHGPGGSQPQQTPPVTPGLKRWSAQQRAGWNCPTCTYYNFGFRTTCFGCKAGQRPAGQQPPAGTGRKPVPSSLVEPWEAKPWEQLEQQLATEKDPEVKALLQQAAALKKKQAASAVKDLPLQDQRSKLTAQVKRLTASLDKQQELLAAQQLKVKELRRELATAHVDLARLPEELHRSQLQVSVAPFGHPSSCPGESRARTTARNSAQYTDCLSPVSHSTPPVLWVATVSSRAVSPDSNYACDRRPVWFTRTGSCMQVHAGKRCVVMCRQLNFPRFLTPVRAAKEDVA